MAHRVEPSRRVEAAQLARSGVRGVVESLYERAARNWRHAPAEIARGLRSAKHLHSRERRFVSDAVYAMVRMRRRLAFWLGGREDALYLAWLAGAGEEPFPDTIDPLLTELKGVALDAAARLAAIADPIERLAIEASYPDWLVANIAGDVGIERARAFLWASNHRAPLFLRANRLKNDRDTLAEILGTDAPTRAIPGVQDGLEVLTHQNVQALDAFQAGRFELQDAASQLIGEIVAPPPRGRVLDLCAGAGGKTLHLAALMNGQGRVTACDISADKLEELKKRARRAGASNIDVYKIEAEGELDLRGPFDRVLVDAPCSGSGVMRRNPETRWQLDPETLQELPVLQLQILERAATQLAPNGRLVYATCSILRVENEEVVRVFLERNSAFMIESIKSILGGDHGEMLRTSPDENGYDGFFCAALKK